MNHLDFIKKLAGKGFIELNNPATDEEIIEVETSLKVKFPVLLKELYKYSNGLYAFNGSLQLYPLNSDDFSILKASDVHRSWDWPVPNEMVLFGDNGQGEPFGLWFSSEDKTKKNFVTQIGEIFEDKPLTILSNSFDDFIEIYFSTELLIEEPENYDLVKEFVDIDKSIIDIDEDKILFVIRDKINPELKKLKSDPYKDRLSAEEVNTYRS